MGLSYNDGLTVRGYVVAAAVAAAAAAAAAGGDDGGRLREWTCPGQGCGTREYLALSSTRPAPV